VRILSFDLKRLFFCEDLIEVLFHLILWSLDYLTIFGD
jgi:hypothetical protein